LSNQRQIVFFGFMFVCSLYSIRAQAASSSLRFYRLVAKECRRAQAFFGCSQ
jgi:hypothetical protein